MTNYASKCFEFVQKYFLPGASKNASQIHACELAK